MRQSLGEKEAERGDPTQVKGYRGRPSTTTSSGGGSWQTPLEAPEGTRFTESTSLASPSQGCWDGTSQLLQASTGTSKLML